MSLINDVLQHVEKQKRKPVVGRRSEFQVPEDEWEESSGAAVGGARYFLSRWKWVALLGVSGLGVFILSQGMGYSMVQGKRLVAADPFYQGFGLAIEKTYALLSPHTIPLHAKDAVEVAAPVAPTLLAEGPDLFSETLRDELFRPATVPMVPAHFSMTSNDEPVAEAVQVEEPAEVQRPKLASLKSIVLASNENAQEEMVLRPLTYSEPRAVMQILSKTQALHRIGGSDEAIRVLLTGIQQYPSTRELRAQLASIYLDLAQLDEAEKTLRIGIRLDPKYMSYTRLMARVLSSKQQLPEAITLLIDSAPAMNEEPEHYSLLAALYQQQGRHDLAAQLYWELISLYPDNGRWWTGLGISLEANKVPQMALESYSKALGTTALEPKLRMFVNQRVSELSKRTDIHRDFNHRESPLGKG